MPMVVPISVSVARRRLCRKPLKNRQAFELLPATGFDPVIEDVRRFAKQLAQPQRSVSRRAFTSGSASECVNRTGLPSDRA
nr:hypothetical protein StreXyl84_77220 [Streptomyces sp. Xyl84]